MTNPLLCLWSEGYRFDGWNALFGAVIVLKITLTHTHKIGNTYNKAPFVNCISYDNNKKNF